METNQAAEHLQVIRTLMERSALYRRAMAPIMTYCGVVGITAGFVGRQLNLNSDRGFLLFWSGVALLALTGTFLLVRRQAFRDSEPLWSPPTRRVAQALLPPFFVGCFFILWITYRNQGSASNLEQMFYAMFLALLYGFALHSAGVFMPRGMKLFGWLFILMACSLILLLPQLVWWEHAPWISPHFVMGGIFGGLHLAYGIYLYFTENRKTAP